MKEIIVLDIGGTNIRAALVNTEGDAFKITKKIKENTGNAPINVIFNSIKHLINESSGTVDTIGLSVAGIVDRTRGILLKSPNITSLEKVNFKNEILERFSLNCVIENDANAATLGENIAGAGKSFDSFVMLTLGTGIGGGVVINKRLLPVAAEVGHISINSDGYPCPCGNIGCLETTASASAIITRAISEIEKGSQSVLKSLYNGNFYKMNAEDIYNAALDGDMLARTLLKDAGKALGIGIASVVNIFSPEAVILTGGLVGAWNIYVESAHKEASRRALKELMADVKIIPSSLGDDAGLIGISYLASEI